jgi:hypothetical protein
MHNDAGGQVHGRQFILDLAPGRWLKRLILSRGPEACLPQHDDPAEAAARLEQALERIAVAARAAAPQAVDIAHVAARLDALIAELRAALAGLGAG